MEKFFIIYATLNFLLSFFSFKIECLNISGKYTLCPGFYIMNSFWNSITVSEFLPFMFKPKLNKTLNIFLFLLSPNHLSFEKKKVFL